MEGTPPMSSYEDETGVKLIIIIIIIVYRAGKDGHGWRKKSEEWSRLEG